jgi:nicotinamide mononucleotide transporter
MSLQEIYTQFIEGMKDTGLLEYIGVITGIASVWFSRNENILVYPVGLISTIIYIYISVKGNLLGEASVNIYYTVMSFYGWVIWSKKDNTNHHLTIITVSDKKEWMKAILFFLAFYVVIFVVLTIAKKDFPAAIPWADAFASASAYTGMWLMAKKKLENWHWWLITDFASIPLYFVKGYVFTSFQFLVFLILAAMGLIEWKKRVKQQHATA